MTVISRIASFVLAGLLSGAASLMIALPAASADPCNTTVGQTASEQIQGYLDRHPDVKATLQAQAGSGTDLIDYLNRHPNQRQLLITLANECTS
jgi:hypothetical protein